MRDQLPRCSYCSASALWFTACDHHWYCPAHLACAQMKQRAWDDERCAFCDEAACERTCFQAHLATQQAIFAAVQAQAHRLYAIYSAALGPLGADLPPWQDLLERHQFAWRCVARRGGDACEKTPRPGPLPVRPPGMRLVVRELTGCGAGARWRSRGGGVAHPTTSSSNSRRLWRDASQEEASHA